MTKQIVPGNTQMQQLPMWPQDLRALPNAFARSALFSAGNLRKGVRKHYKRYEVAAVMGISITYTGEELMQDDEDLYLQILHMARHQDVRSSVSFTANALIRELGWTRNSASYRRLSEGLDRMQASSLSLTVTSSSGARENYTGSLIRSFRWKDDSGEAAKQWTVLLEPEIANLFAPDAYSRLDWNMRLKLAPLEKWLHSFFHTHHQPYPYKVETFWRLTGSNVPLSELRKFRARLKKALATLVDVGFFLRAEIDPKTDLVHVERNRGHLSIVNR